MSMKILALALGTVLLAACSSEAQKAEERYELVAKTSISASDKCEAAEAAKAAWIADGDENKAVIATAREYVDCSQFR